MDNFIALDIETTGLSPMRDKIIEIGAVRVQGGEPTDTFCEFINPEIPLPEKIQKLTGITDVMLENAADAATVVDRFLEFAGDGILLGHNIIFDYSFIKNHLFQRNKEFSGRGMDTLKLAKRLLPELESRSLGYLCQYFQIPSGISHRALDDAMASYHLYQLLKERYYKENIKIFSSEDLVCTVKKAEPITTSQKNYLNDLIKYHKIEFNRSQDDLCKSEASKIIDGIILKHGRILRKRTT